MGLLAALALLLVPALAAGVLLWASPAPQRPEPTAYSPGGGNLTLLASAAEDAGLPVDAAVAGLEPATGRALVIVAGAARPPRAAETAALDRVLDSGGTVWIAGGSAYVPWLAARGASLGGQPLLQAGSANPGDVTLAGGLGGDLFTNVASRLPGTILLEEGSAWQVWLSAPADAHADLDRDGVIGEADPPGPFPVGAALRTTGGGLLLATADASLLSDDALGGAGSDNAALWRALLSQAGPDRVVVDESQHGWTRNEGPMVTLLHAASALRALPAGLLALAALCACALAVAVVLAGGHVTPFVPHVPADPADPVQGGDVDVQDVAWDLLALRTGRPLAELRSGGHESAQGLAEDPALRRILLGQGNGTDRLAILSQYTQDQEPQP